MIYGTETWAIKADDLRSLERTERMMVRWMCGVSLKDRKRSEDLCNLLGINCVVDGVRRGRLRWFGHLERKSVDDWVSACRGLVVEGTRGRGRSRKTWEQCVRDDMKLCHGTGIIVRLYGFINVSSNGVHVKTKL